MKKLNITPCIIISILLSIIIISCAETRTNYNLKSTEESTENTVESIILFDKKLYANSKTVACISIDKYLGHKDYTYGPILPIFIVNPKYMNQQKKDLMLLFDFYENQKVEIKLNKIKFYSKNKELKAIAFKTSTGFDDYIYKIDTVLSNDYNNFIYKYSTIIYLFEEKIAMNDDLLIIIENGAITGVNNEIRQKFNIKGRFKYFMHLNIH